MASNMNLILICITTVVLIGNIRCNPSPALGTSSIWKGTPMNEMIEEMRSNCDSGSDSFACIKMRVVNFIDTIFKKDNFQLSNDVEVRANGYRQSDSTENGRSQNGEKGFLENVKQYLQSHDVTFKLPIENTKVTVSPRNLNSDELNLKIKFSDENGNDVAEGKSKKSKLKKIAVPIMVFVLLKALTLIPLALGILGLKAWNALQLGFFSFVVSVGLAIFQLCKKLAGDHHPPAVVAAHGPWESRSFNLEPVPEYDAQNLAYSAYA